MLPIAMTLAMLAAPPADPLGAAQARFAALGSYEVTIHSSGDRRGAEVIHYLYRRPDHVRMEFDQPHHGAVIVYDPASRRAVVWPFGPGHFPRLVLSPGNPLIRGARGQRIDQSSVGALLASAQALQAEGKTSLEGQTMVGTQHTWHVVVTGAGNAEVAGGIHRYDLWLATGSLFPVKVQSRDVAGQLLESVRFDDVRLNVPLAARLFDPRAKPAGAPAAVAVPSTQRARN